MRFHIKAGAQVGEQLADAGGSDDHEVVPVVDPGAASEGA
jgi:hypothetical protein